MLTTRAAVVITETIFRDNDVKSDNFSNPIVWPNEMNTNIDMGKTDNITITNLFIKSNMSKE
jgi:hypothetical protein